MKGGKRVAITGAGGFLGSAVSERLKASGHEVLDLISPAASLEAKQGICLDITDGRAVSAVLREFKPDVVVHAAGLAHFKKTDSVDRLFSVNVDGSLNVFKGARESAASRLVYLSSVLVYGEGANAAIDEDSETLPSSEYGESKLLAERAASQTLSSGGTTLSILRLSMVPAPKNYSNLSDLVESINSGTFRWVGAGENRRSMLTLSDFLGAVEVVVDAPPSKGGGTFNLASEAVTMRAIVECISEALGRPVPAVRIPEWFARLVAEAAGGHFGIPSSDILRNFVSSFEISNKRFTEEFGYRFAGNVLLALREFARAFVRQ